MNSKIKYIPFFALLFSNCKDENNKVGRPIVLGDSSLIVTEKDSQYLKNFTEDISPSSSKNSAGYITKMMVQVDSMKASKKIEEENLVAKTLNGFTINFDECSIIFNGLQAHALKLDQDERKLNSVSYIKDGGEFLDMNLEVKGLENVRIEQRLITKLSVENGTENYILNDLGKFTSPWYNLAGKSKMFVSVSSNSIQFNNVDNSKIRNAVDREVRKKKISREEIAAWLKLVEKTNSYSDQPCKVIISSAQWRIWGTQSGKKIQKLIQFDIPL